MIFPCSAFRPSGPDAVEGEIGGVAFGADRRFLGFLDAELQTVSLAIGDRLVLAIETQLDLAAGIAR